MSDFKPIISRKLFDEMVDANFVRKGDEVRFEIISDNPLINKHWKDQKIAEEVEDRLNDEMNWRRKVLGKF